MLGPRDSFRAVASNPRLISVQTHRAEQVIFTNPYDDAGSEKLIVSVAAPVFASSGSTSLLGVVGLDIDLSLVGIPIESLHVIGENGYAYILAPGGMGEVAAHPGLNTFGSEQYISNLEAGVDDEEFEEIISNVSAACTGGATYQKDGETWILSWEHEGVSGLSTVNETCAEGFIVVVTVSEAALLEVGVSLFTRFEPVVHVCWVLPVGRVRLCRIYGVSFVGCSTAKVRHVVSFTGLTGARARHRGNREDGRWMLSKSGCFERIGILITAMTWKCHANCGHFGFCVFRSGVLQHRVGNSQHPCPGNGDHGLGAGRHLLFLHLRCSFDVDENRGARQSARGRRAGSQPHGLLAGGMCFDFVCLLLRSVLQESRPDYTAVFGLQLLTVLATAIYFVEIERAET